ncbi:hypothetical protein QQ056_19905 [Oscillatoria laete-virens NRMC-F 0139]|nr:hypothetical protein [Oscillatoria laete-virens]MDL5055797.1 hypothetical protein [Oscillatoria laete-virens NRMC-F 0139]
MEVGLMLSGLILRMSFVIGLFVVLLTATLAVGQAMPRRQLTFMSYKDINPDIYLADLDRGLILNLTAHPAYDASIAWSPDGERLAFMSNRDRGINIYLMHGLGGSVQRITPRAGIYTNLRWSSDGSRLVFYEQPTAFNSTAQALGYFTPTLWTANADGTELRNLGSDVLTVGSLLIEMGLEDSSVIQPALSPDGSEIAVLRFEDRRWNLYLADPNRRNPRFLTHVGRAGSEFPTWSPDGRHLAYISTMHGGSDIYIINRDGSAPPYRVTFDRAVEISLIWRPSP